MVQRVTKGALGGVRGVGGVGPPCRVRGPRAMEGTDPVNKKLAAALSGGAVLVVALTGCSSSGGDKGPDPKLVAWAKSVCDAVPAQDAKIKAANAAISTTAADTAKPETLQKTDSQAFQDMADGYKAIATAVSDAGAPPGVSDGA